MKRIKTLHPPAYIDGVMQIYDIVDVPDPDSPDAPIRKIKNRVIGNVPFRMISLYDRTRLTFEQAGIEINYKIAVPRWDGITSNCICVIDSEQYKVYNVTQTETRDGFEETEITLINPEVQYEEATE